MAAGAGKTKVLSLLIAWSFFHKLHEVELDLPQKMARLKQWCADATAAEENGQSYDFVFVDQTGFEKHLPKTFAALAAGFVEYKS
jgi:hypothetical protein